MGCAAPGMVLGAVLGTLQNESSPGCPCCARHARSEGPTQPQPLDQPQAHPLLQAEHCQSAVHLRLCRAFPPLPWGQPLTPICPHIPVTPRMSPSAPPAPAAPQDTQERTASGCGDGGSSSIPGTHRPLPLPCRPGSPECGEVTPGDVPVHDGGAQAPGVDPLLPRGGPRLAEQGECRCRGPPGSPPQPELRQPLARATAIPQCCAKAGMKARRTRRVFQCFGSCKSPVLGWVCCGRSCPVCPSATTPSMDGMAPGSLPCPVQ